MKTLICVRKLPYSEPTVKFGTFVAGLEKSPVTLMTVIESEDKRQPADKELMKARDMMDLSSVETKIRVGQVLPQILAEAREGDYELIVVGSKDMEGLVDALFGTLTAKVTDQAQSSVLVVKEDKHELKRILIPIGGQKMSERVVKAGASLAKAAGARVTLLYVAAPVPTMYTGLEGIEETLAELLQSDTPVSAHLRAMAQYLADEGVSADLEMMQGVASDEIMRLAIQGDYDLVVIGAPGIAGPLKRLLIDRVTPHVVEKAPCCVLVVR